MITDFCRLRLNPVLDGEEANAVAGYLIGLLEILGFPPYRGKWIDWAEVAVATGVDAARLKEARHRLQPIFDALSRSIAMQDAADLVRPAKPSKAPEVAQSSGEISKRSKRGPKPKAIVDLPEPLWTEWEDPAEFAQALVMHMRRHGDSVTAFGFQRNGVPYVE